MRLLLALMVAVSARAGIVDTNVTGFFDSPILSGLSFDPSGTLVFVNNTATAVSTGVGSATLGWGDGTPSTVHFTGASTVGVLPDTEFVLGSVEFFNGTAAAGNTLILGATLHLASGVIGTSVDGVDLPFLIFSRTNSHPNPADNADYLSVLSLGLDLNVLEGQSARFEIRGRIVGDPYIEATSIVVAPGYEALGFVSQTVPEPATALLMLAGVTLAVLRKASNGRPLTRTSALSSDK